jgi:putative thioredoxin
MTHDITDFVSEVIERSKTTPVLVDFWAEWCAPCRILGPVLEKLAGGAEGKWILRKLDTEQFPQIAQQYGVRSIPAVKLFIDGKIVEEFVGVIPEQAIVRWLKKALRAKPNPAVESARELLFQLRFSEAAALLDPIVATELDNTHARVLLAKALFFTDPDRAAALVNSVEPGDEGYELAESIRLFHSLRSKCAGQNLPGGPARTAYSEAVNSIRNGEFNEALARFIEVIKEDRYYDDDGSRRAGIAIFKFLGEDHPITLKWRREFNSSLFR